MPHADPVGHALLSSVDLLSFWAMALLVLGLSAAARAPRRRVAILVVALWALYVLGKAGLTRDVRLTGGVLETGRPVFRITCSEGVPRAC